MAAMVQEPDMTHEIKEEGMDTCITAVEKHHTDMEKCTQVVSDHGLGTQTQKQCYDVHVLHDGLQVTQCRCPAVCR